MIPVRGIWREVLVRGLHFSLSTRLAHYTPMGYCKQPMVTHSGRSFSPDPPLCGPDPRRESPGSRPHLETLRLSLRWPYVAPLNGSAHPRLITKRGGGIEMTELAHRRH